jgi:rhamnosyltransferase subunit B
VRNPANKPLDILLPTLGSAGDVHPVIALALGLQQRGHRATILTNPFFQEQIEGLGLGFVPIGTISDAQRVMADPRLWHPRKGFECIAQEVMIPSLRPVYRAIEERVSDDTVVVASGISFGARIANEKLGVPMASLHLQPSIIRSLVDQGLAGDMRISATQPMWFKKTFFWLADRIFIDKNLKRPINEFRAELGLPPVDRILYRWMHSPQLVIGFFPEWFAAAQPDWPPNTHCVGFVLWDAAGHAAVPANAEAFLNGGEPPVIFTPGSAAATLYSFFDESVKAARQLGIRAMLVTNHPDQLPSHLPANVRSFGYLPFSEVLPRTALMVHHGGIGTMAQTIRAGVPHIVVPNGHDQFDNGWRIEQLKLGVSIRASRYSAKRVSHAIRDILSDGSMKSRCVKYSSRIDSDAALARACALVEDLHSSGMENNHVKLPEATVLPDGKQS